MPQDHLDYRGAHHLKADPWLEIYRDDKGTTAAECTGYFAAGHLFTILPHDGRQTIEVSFYRYSRKHGHAGELSPACLLAILQRHFRYLVSIRRRKAAHTAALEHVMAAMSAIETRPKARRTARARNRG